MSVQAAGVIKMITVYTDNRYGFGNINDSMAFFGEEGKRQAGKQIAHASIESNLLDSLLLPQEMIAVCESEAHTKA